MSFFKRWNNLTGWTVFAVAAAVYLMTMEPSASLWDCSEFIATSYKLEVGHPPGAPLFMMLARLATLFAPSTHYVPHLVNAMNSIASAFCILFLFWTITHMARRMLTGTDGELSRANAIAALGAGAVGALAYTFTDTFWFSAVEGEVYALSSMFTALVVWLMMKWEEQADQPHALRWIVLIAYLMGLSIGVHILNLLTIPALVFIYYFRRTERVTWKGAILATLIAGAILISINGIIIPFTVYIGAMLDVLFVNTLHLPVNSGMIFFALVLLALLGWGVWRTHRKGATLWNTILLSCFMILVGYSSYASVSIRAAANPPMNSNHPDNPHALFSVLNRDQYGNRPLLYGAYYSAPIVESKSKNVYYLDEERRYRKTSILDDYVYPPQFMHLFPRMWNYTKGENAYKEWAAYRTKTETVRDADGQIVRDETGRPLRQEVYDFGRKVPYFNGYETQTVVEPTFGENLNFFFSYQLSYMYWRYFLWNFVGRQSDIQPDQVTLVDGNWLSGIRPIDEIYLGPQENLPDEVAGNRGRNTYYFLPFILGLIGLLYQLNRDPRNFSVGMWLFIMMGIALVVYFNTSPSEPRERDYVYAGSFYAFAMWIGLGVLAVRDLLKRALRRDGRWVAAAATAVCLSVPCLLAAENWDDHDRSHRTTSRDIGWNYLQSVLPDAILINYGDNDTFPIWFNQEVDGVRTDVRVMNASYLGAEWYIEQMKTRANEAAPVPFSLPSSKYTGTNEVLYIYDRVNRTVDIREAIDFIRSDDPRTKLSLADGSQADYLPTRRLGIPVDRENAIASGIVSRKDRDLMVDTVYVELRKNAISRSDLLILDMLAHFDWKRPIHFTQPHLVQELGLLDYLQFDGFTYRLVPIRTSYKETREIGRIDPDQVYPLLMDTFRYGNLADERVYSDHFSQQTLAGARAREGFARTAKAFLRRDGEGDREKAVALLDAGMERLPVGQIRFSFDNTFPFIEGYYGAGEMQKGDELVIEYAENLMQYIDWYLSFDEVKGELLAPLLDEKLNDLNELYWIAGYAGRQAPLSFMNDFYVSLGIPEDQLVRLDEDPLEADPAAPAR